jgi:hypothetical protein
METKAVKKSLEWLLDVEEIREALTQYFCALDRLDGEGAKRIFDADAHEDHGPVVGRAHDFVDNALPLMRVTHERMIHRVIHASVDISGDTAISEAQWTAILCNAVTDQFYVGRYIDRWVRRDAGWRITHRLAITDWWRYEARNAQRFAIGAEAILRFAGCGLEDARVRAALELP